MKNDFHYFVKSTDDILPDSGMIIPFRHVATPFEYTDEEWQSLQKILCDVKKILDESAPQGYNLGWNIGKVGGQEVAHAHLHIIARFEDEPLAGKGIRAHLKALTNKRLSK